MEATLRRMLMSSEWPLAVNILRNRGYTTKGILHIELVEQVVLQGACKESLLYADMMEEVENKLMWGRG